MQRIKHRIQRAKKDEEDPKKILRVVINGHKIEIKNWRFTQIKIKVDGKNIFHIINPNVNNKYTMYQVLYGLRNNTCINPCHLCDKHCVHCKCLKPCGLCDIRKAWRENKEITDIHRQYFIDYENDYKALQEKLYHEI